MVLKKSTTSYLFAFFFFFSFLFFFFEIFTIYLFSPIIEHVCKLKQYFSWKKKEKNNNNNWSLSLFTGSNLEPKSTQNWSIKLQTPTLASQIPHSTNRSITLTFIKKEKRKRKKIHTNQKAQNWKSANTIFPNTFSLCLDLEIFFLKKSTWSCKTFLLYQI